MAMVFVVCVIVCDWAEERGNPMLTEVGTDQAAHDSGADVLALCDTNGGTLPANQQWHDGYGGWTTGQIQSNMSAWLTALQNGSGNGGTSVGCRK